MMQTRTGSSGSDALSHAYIQSPPIRCNIPETRGLLYDDGNKLLLSPTADQVLSWKVGAPTEHNPPNSDLIGEGPVLSIRYSLDQKAIAIQRSNHEVEFRNRETGLTFSRKCKQDSERILGLFWTDCPTCDIILIKTSGIEMLLYDPEQNSLHIMETKKLNVTWYVYTHESRMLLLASGMQCTVFSGYQFSAAAGIVRLPKFEMSMTKSEANSKPVLSSDDVHIVTIYGRIYCLQFDRVGMHINVYRFYRDAVVEQGSIPAYSSRVAVSSVDNVILAHQLDAKVVMLYDLFLDSLSPISAPLPLLLKGSYGTNSRSTSEEAESISNAYEGMMYLDSWNFLVPDLICDVDNGLVWRICLDVEAISASSSDVPSILQFLQRRRFDPAMIKALCLAITRTLILEKRPISVIAQAMDVLIASYSNSLRSGSIPSATQNTGSNHATDSGAASEQAIASADRAKSVIGDSSSNVSIHSPSTSDDAVNPEESEEPVGDRSLKSAVPQPMASHGTSVAISPDEMHRFVFTLVEDEMSGDPSYLVSVIVEFLRSASREKLKLNPDIYLMMNQLLARSNQHTNIALFVSNKIIEPSKEVAMQLVDLGQQNLKIRKLGLDMLRLLALHHDYVSVLLQDGYYLEALRYARKNKVITVQPALFLEAAMASNEALHLAAVMRFFSDFAPSFKTTVDYGRYQQILSELS
ncbi:C18orf8 [Carex rostrata]